MKVLLLSIGTRGDMEPFLAIGQLMQEKGHDVTCLFPEQFKQLVADSGFQFESLGTEFIAMLESDLGKFALGGGGSWLKKMSAFARLAKIQISNNKQMIQKQHDVVARLNPDTIIHNGKALYPFIWEVSHPRKNIYISPVPYLHYVKGHTHTAFHSNYGTWLNKLTYALSDWGITKTILSLSKNLGITALSKKDLKHALKKQKVIYTISPQLFERPSYWPTNRFVLGYHERDKTVNWQPDNALSDFLIQHPKCIFVTFGSMTNPEPEEKTNTILTILKRHQIPAIINTSTGGLVKPQIYDSSLFHFVSNIPYDWIFPKIYAVIHHGGSGTTHMAVKYGCAAMIIPHVIDQFIWNNIIHEQKLGPRGIKVSKITEHNLEPKILDLVHNVQYKTNAQSMAKKMAEETILLREALYHELIQ